MSADPKKRAARKTGRPGGGRWTSPANLLTSLVLVYPLFLAYELSVLFLPDVANGADLITGRLASVLGSPGNFLLFQGGMTLLFVLTVAVLKGRERFELRMFVPVVLESAIYALLVGPIIVHLMGALGIDPKLQIEAAAATPLPGNPGTLSKIALAFGAGVHEELLFRLLLIPALVFLFQELMGLGRFFGTLLAFVLSSLVFSAAHHVIGGEPWHLAPFVYRFFCGLLFALAFRLRGFAVAVYTHALYDIYVMLLN